MEASVFRIWAVCWQTLTHQARIGQVLKSLQDMWNVPVDLLLWTVDVSLYVLHQERGNGS